MLECYGQALVACSAPAGAGDARALALSLPGLVAVAVTWSPAGDASLEVPSSCGSHRQYSIHLFLRDPRCALG